MTQIGKRGSVKTLALPLLMLNKLMLVKIRIYSNTKFENYQKAKGLKL